MRRLKAVGEEVPLLWSANFSLGIAVFVRALRENRRHPVAGFRYRDYGDTPQPKGGCPQRHGQAAAGRGGSHPCDDAGLRREGNCGKRDKREIGIHALRGGTVAGTHTVSFFGPDEEFSITHRAASRQIFVNGALHMARLLPGKPAGAYDLQTILFGK